MASRAKTKPTTRQRKRAAAWQTPAVRARCLKAAIAACMPTFRVDDAMKSDKAMLQFAADSDESLDWLVGGHESHRRHQNARPAKREGEHPHDTISKSVQKSHGIVATLLAATGGNDDDWDLNKQDLHNMFWALHDLLLDACKAMDSIIEESLAERDRKAGSAP